MFVVVIGAFGIHVFEHLDSIGQVLFQRSCLANHDVRIIEPFAILMPLGHQRRFLDCFIQKRLHRLVRKRIGRQQNGQNLVIIFLPVFIQGRFRLPKLIPGNKIGIVMGRQVMICLADRAFAVLRTGIQAGSQPQTGGPTEQRVGRIGARESRH